MDILPDVKFGPVGDGEHANTFTLVGFTVIKVPQFRALILGVPAMILVTEGVNPFLGSRFFLIAARTAESGIKFVLVQRLLQGLGLHNICMLGTAMGERSNAFFYSFLIDMND